MPSSPLDLWTRCASACRCLHRQWAERGTAWQFGRWVLPRVSCRSPICTSWYRCSQPALGRTSRAVQSQQAPEGLGGPQRRQWLSGVSLRCALDGAARSNLCSNRIGDSECSEAATSGVSIPQRTCGR